MDSFPQSQHRFRWLLPIALGLVPVVGVALFFRGETRGPKVPLPPPPPIVAPVPLAANPSQPRLTWSEKTVLISLAPGEIATRRVTFTSTLALDSLHFEPVPAIADFVSVTPSDLPGVAAGQLQRVRLSFSVPTSTALGQYDGTIQVRSGGRTVPQPLSIVLTVRPPELPPDPGEAGDATLAGVDSDGDGVRDDLERYIAFTYPASAKTRAALRQYAEVAQTFILDAPDASTSIGYALERQKARDCLYYIRFSDARDLSTSLRAELLNTTQRSRAYVMADAHLSGQVFSLTPYTLKKSGCEFDPETLGD